MAEDSTSRCEHTVREPPTDTDLQEVLEGADNIFYEAKEDIPGVRFQKHGKENWVPVRAALDSIHKDDIHYLKGCKSVRFFRSADGTPSLSLHRGKCRFPTPICSGSVIDYHIHIHTLTLDHVLSCIFILLCYCCVVSHVLWPFLSSRLNPVNLEYNTIALRTRARSRHDT